MRRARYRRWTQPSPPLRPSTADPAQGPETALWEASDPLWSYRRALGKWHRSDHLCPAIGFVEGVISYYRKLLQAAGRLRVAGGPILPHRFRWRQRRRFSPSTSTFARPRHAGGSPSGLTTEARGGRASASEAN